MSHVAIGVSGGRGSDSPRVEHIHKTRRGQCGRSEVNTAEGIKPGIGQIMGKLIIQGFVGPPPQKKRNLAFMLNTIRCHWGGSEHGGGVGRGERRRHAMSWDSSGSL